MGSWIEEQVASFTGTTDRRDRSKIYRVDGLNRKKGDPLWNMVLHFAIEGTKRNAKEVDGAYATMDRTIRLINCKRQTGSSPRKVKLRKTSSVRFGSVRLDSMRHVPR